MRSYGSSSAAMERISRRFMDDDQRRIVPQWEADAAPAPAARPESGPRFDVLRGGRQDQCDDVARVETAPPPASAPARAPVPASEPAPQAPPASPFSATRRAAGWAPVPASTQSAAVEQYRRLAAALLHAQAEHGVKVIMVTSSVAGEGKSLTAANLAMILSRSYQRNILIIDMDQRDPSQHLIFRVENTRGLGETLSAFDMSTVPVLQLFPGLDLLTAGRPTGDPMGGLTSSRMKQLLADAASHYDFVIVDTPPAAVISDAALVAPLVDAVVLVIAAGETQFEAIDRAISAIGRERILGTVLNRAEQTSLGDYGYGYGHGTAGRS